MGQSKKHSLIEIIVNIVVGLAISLILTHYLFNISLAYNVVVTIIYTAASLIRGYILRRVFNKIMLCGRK